MTKDEFSFLPDWLAAGMTDYVAIITRFSAEGTIGEIDCVYLSWETRAPDGFNDGQIAALQRVAPYLALAIKSVSLARMTGTLMKTYLGRDAGRACSADGSCAASRSKSTPSCGLVICEASRASLTRPGAGNSIAERLLRCDRLRDPRAWR